MGPTKPQTLQQPPKWQLPMWHRYRVELYPHLPQPGGIKDEFGNDLHFPAAFRKCRREHTGTTKAFMIVVPSSEVTMPRHPEANTAFRQKLGKKAVMWVPAAPEGYATHFATLSPGQKLRPPRSGGGRARMLGPDSSGGRSCRTASRCGSYRASGLTSSNGGWPQASANLKKPTTLWNRGDCITDVIA
jgi:hypothetical protein